MITWQVQSMTDPGDGIVTTQTFEHESDDICEVAADVMNGETSLGQINGWIFALEAMAE